MNEASRWRLQMARGLAPAYTTDSRVQAVIVGGSAAQGHADDYSDVEIGIFWDEFPTAVELRAAMERSGGALWELDPYIASDDVWYEEYAIGGLKMDLRHMTVGRMSELLTGVVDGDDVSEERQAILFAVQHGVVLHGASLAERWQGRAACYPDRLARAMVGRYLSFEPWWAVAMYAERGDLPLVYGAFSEAARRILGALLGLNRVYHPGLKWIERTIATLKVAPPDLAARLRQTFRDEPIAGARQMQQLIEETFDLIEQHMSEVELAEARREFRYRRPAVATPLPDRP